LWGFLNKLSALKICFLGKGVVGYGMKVIKKETLFEVKQGDKTHVVKAFDLAHAKRIAARLFQCEVIECEPLKQFPRFDERKIGKFNR